MKGPHSPVEVNLEHQFGEPFLQNRRSPRKLPGATPPVVTYSRLDVEEEDALDFADERAEPRFAGEAAAEWDAVEIPRVEPPLRPRRRPSVAVDNIAGPEEAGFADPIGIQPRRSSFPLRLVALIAVVAVAAGIGLLVYSFGSSTAITVSAPALDQDDGGPAPGTEPAGDVANVTPAVREIPLSGEAGEPPAAAVVAPPAPRVRPDRPVPATATINPDFDQAAPAAPTRAEPQAANPPVDPAPDDDFIAKIERTLAQTPSAPAEPALSPAGQPRLLQPMDQQDMLLPPEPIPLTDGQGQPLVLPNDYLLLDTD
jgi:hypothetical protein